MRLSTAWQFLLLLSVTSKVFGATPSRPHKKIASGSGIRSITDGVSNIQSPSQYSPTQRVNVITTITNTFPNLGVEISSLLRQEGVSSCNEFMDKKFKPKEESEGSYKSPPHNVTIPLTIRDEDKTLDKFKSVLYESMAALRKDGKAPRDNNDEEKEIWDTLSVLGYLLVQKLHPLIVSKCDDGEFQCKTIDQLGKELRGVYRMLKEGKVKTGLSNEVEGGVIVRMYRQYLDLQLEDDIDIYDEEADEEDKKRISVKKAREYLISNHDEDVAVYFTVDEQMEMVQSDDSLMEIVKAIGMISPAFAGWDESMLDKRSEEIINYGFEAVCACSFGGSKYHNVMEMFFNLGSTTLRQMIELPSTVMNQLVVELLRRRTLSPEQIKCIFTWQTLISAVRKKGVELRADTDISSNIKTGYGVGDMIRDFHPDDPASFLQLLENQILFGSKSISYIDAYPSQSYAQVVTAAQDIVSVLESDTDIDDKQDEIITHVQSLYGLDRYDDPKGSNAYVNAVNNTLVKVEQEANIGMLVIENTMKDVSKFNDIFPTYKNTLHIKNADETFAGSILSDNNDSTLILTLPSLHLMRGVKVTDKQRFVTRQAQLSIMKCLCDAGMVSDTALETQQKAAYSQLLWTEGIGVNDAKAVMSDESNIDKCDGSSEKGRMVVLGSLSRITPVKEGVDFIGKLMSGKYVFNADSMPHLRKNVTENSIDNVVVACLVAALGLDNFASVMDIGYGINRKSTGMDFLGDGKTFSDWLTALKGSLGRCEESRDNIQRRYGLRDGNEGGEEVGDGGEVEEGGEVVDGDEGESSSDEEELPFAVFGAAPTRG